MNDELTEKSIQTSTPPKYIYIKSLESAESMVSLDFTN